MHKVFLRFLAAAFLGVATLAAQAGNLIDPYRFATLPAFISATSYEETTNASGARTFSHSTTADTTCLAVAASWRSGAAPGAQSATFNGVSLTMGPDVGTSTSSPAGRSTIFYLCGGTVPIGTFTVSYTSSSNQQVDIVAVNMRGVSQLGPTDSATSTSNTVATSVTTTTPAVIISTSGMANTGSCTLTGTSLQNGNTSAFTYCASYIELAAAATQGVTASYGVTTKKTIASASFIP